MLLAFPIIIKNKHFFQAGTQGEQQIIMWGEENHDKFMNPVKVLDLQTKKKRASAQTVSSISFYLARIILWLRKRLHAATVHCTVRADSSRSKPFAAITVAARADLPGVISIFPPRGHSPVENNIPVRGFINPCYVSPFGWCLTMQPSGPKTSWNLSVFVFGCFFLSLCAECCPLQT